MLAAGNKVKGMSQFFYVHPETPQQRLIKQAVHIIKQGGVVVYPTDSGYALGCHIGDKAAMERILQIRHISGDHHFTLMCRDLSELSIFNLNKLHLCIRNNHRHLPMKRRHQQ